jgi:aryl-alcohol dehydrogenase-like predicted oxidoreductase
LISTIQRIGFLWQNSFSRVVFVIFPRANQVTSVEHVEEAAEAVDLDLSRADVEYLEEPYEALPVKGHK